MWSYTGKLLVNTIPLVMAIASYAQLITLDPAEATGNDELTIIFDASEGTAGLVGASTVYMHSGVVTSVDGTSWEYVVGNWGEDDTIGEMTTVEGETDKWQITITPREYYAVPDGTNIFRLAMVFRNADGSGEGKGATGTYDWGMVSSSGDIFVDLTVDAYVHLVSPVSDTEYVTMGGSLSIEAEASSEVSAMSLKVNDVEKVSVSSGTTISYDYTPSVNEEITIAITAIISGVEVSVSKTVDLIIRPETVIANLPAGIKKGINYLENGTSVTLVLEAPDKEFAYVVGDFTEWELEDEFLMNQTPDGELFWLTIDDLSSGQPYVFQYWVEGTIKVGDPYADQVADPWNDPDISESVYSDLPAYNFTDYGIATVLQTGQEAYAWQSWEDTWETPVQDDLVIYELLIRDFIGSHNYSDLADTLSYLKRLGVNAIELMPITEFEGNSSWGYNPIYFFAPDKYYGTKSELKYFVETAHQQGFAVIMDMVLNHAYGENPMVMMYWDEDAGTVSEDNPWFNAEAPHLYVYGYDFNHESSYTQDFVDTVTSYWVNEYHIDGYRFDLSKGFTQTQSTTDSEMAAYDQSRIDILNRMADQIWATDENTYVILEHFAEDSEESVLAGEGMLLWRNLNYAFYNSLQGNTYDISGGQIRTRVAYMESHDEARMAYEMLIGGQSSGGYDITNETVLLERAKMGAAFHLLQAGPKMIWQFGELGYDIDIDYNERTGEKPLVWGDGNLGYYESENRQYVFDAYAAIIDLRNSYPLVIRSGSYTSTLSGDLKRMSIYHPTLQICVVGNFGVEDGSLDPAFYQTGDWFDYFSGEEIEVTDVNEEIELAPGEFHIYTSSKVSDGFPGVVEVYQNPVTVEPEIFTASEEITIIFDATKADADDTNGLVGAEKVYMQAGIVSDPDDVELSHVVGNLVDDGVGQMTRVDGEDNKWTITFTPSEYFSLSDTDDAYSIGMYFRDADNENLGMGFRGELVYVDILQEGNIVSVTPSSFSVEDEITITFNAALGTRGLISAEDVYVHSGVVLSDVDEPTGDDWANVVGNWGSDDGIGQMAKVDDSNLWQITITPADYYSLSGDAYWMAMVFRDASGNAKGSGSASEFEGGFINESGDIFVNIPNRKTVLSAEGVTTEVRVYPNPTSDFLTIILPSTDERYYIFDSSGKLVLDNKVNNSRTIEVSELKAGVYFLKTRSETLRFIITK